jgi:PAS domain S-box-containing protein
MSEVVDEQVRNVLQAMRQKLGFTSATLARLDTERGGLVLSFSMGERLPLFKAASNALGFDPTGATFPIWAEESFFMRSYREGRLMSTTDFEDLIRGALPREVLAAFASSIGSRLFVCVPVPGASGAILAVIMLDRSKTTPLTPDERDQLLLYSARVGQFLEADRLGATVLGPGQDSPVARWLSVHLLDRSLRTVWSGGVGPAARSVVAVLGEVKPGQFEVTLATGAAVLVHVYTVDPTGQVSWLLLCEDLARRDREVRDLREQLRLRLARVREAVISLDAEARVTGVNDATRDILGFEPAEMIGQSATAFIPKGQVKPSHRKLAKDLVRNGHVERQVRLQRRDGSSFPAEISVLMLADEGQEPAGAIATVRDLSEQKRQAAERLQLRRKLLRSERLAALGEMAARIAHEVRNPLAAIGAAALSIEEDEEGGSVACEQARAIGSEVRRLDTILNDLLRFARPRPPVRAPVEVGELVRNAVMVARADPQARGLEFDLLIGDTCYIQADADGLRQVLMNLLRNATEACAGQGGVTCKVSCKVGKSLIEVTDSGPGLTAAARRRAFEPFFSTKSRGTGLGLPISRRIIEEHGGTMALRSRRGGGTTVVIELDLTEPPAGKEGRPS